MGFFSFLQKSPPQEWVDLIFEPGANPKKVTISYMQQASKAKVEECLRIMDDCLNIMKKTKKFDVFFYRYELWLDKLTFLTKLEPYCNFHHPKPSFVLAKAKESEYETIEPFIRVRFNEVWDMAHGESTTRVKINRIKKLIELMGEYKDKIPDSVYIHYIKKLKKLLAEIENL